AGVRSSPSDHRRLDSISLNVYCPAARMDCGHFVAPGKDADMPRIGLLLLVALVATSVRADEKEQRFRAILAVQNAMAEAEDHLKKGNYQAAVTALERQIAHIDGNKHYLDMMREAYVGHIAQLRKAGQEPAANRYSERLRILQPGLLVSSPSTTPAPKMPAPKMPAPAPKVSVRGKIDDRVVDDPFSARNIATKPGTAGLIESADQA